MGRYFNLSQVGAFSFVSLVSILNLLLLYGIARKILKLPSWAALAGAMIFGFGATAWSYAITLYQHQLTVFFMFSSFYAAWKFRRQAALGWLWAFWVWLAYGLAITVDYPNAVLLLPVIVYFLASALKAFRIPEGVRLMLRPAALLTVVALFAVFGWNAYHNQENFGSWKRLSGQLPGYRALKESPAEQPPDSTESLNKLAEQQGLQGFFQETNIPFSFYTLTVSPDRGLFFYAPIFILGILGLFLSRKYFSLEKGVLISLAAVNLFLYSSWGDPWGGWAYGPRYLIPSMAVLSLFAGLWLAKTRWQLAGKAAALLLFAYSSAVALLGAITSNAVPPKIEAVDLPLKYYNYFYNLYLLRQNKSGSLLYNIYFSGSVSLGTYFLFIYSAVLLLAAFILFILPRFRHEH